MKKWDDYSLVWHARFAMWMLLSGAAASMVLYTFGTPDGAWSHAFVYAMSVSAVLFRLQQRLARLTPTGAPR